MNPLRPASRDDLLTLAEAVEVLGARRVDAVAWMRGVGIVHGVLRREYVIRHSIETGARSYQSTIPAKARAALERVGAGRPKAGKVLRLGTGGRGQTRGEPVTSTQAVCSRRTIH